MTTQSSRTRPFDETVRARAGADPDFRDGLLADALTAFSGHDLPVAKTLIRHYIHASIGFTSLAEQMGKSPKSLMRMFGPSGNPTSEHLSQVFALLQDHSRITLTVSVETASGRHSA